jgi:Type-F conjugative transfer system protein (TrbI_Ftype)
VNKPETYLPKDKNMTLAVQASEPTQADLFPQSVTQDQQRPYPRSIFGFPPLVAALSALLLGVLLWNLWLTKKVIDNPPQPIVSVSLKVMLQDKMRELAARPGVSQDALGYDLKLYTLALQASVEDLQKEGKIVLVSEAMLGTPSRDITNSMRSRTAKNFESLKAAQAKFGSMTKNSAGGES